MNRYYSYLNNLYHVLYDVCMRTEGDIELHDKGLELLKMIQQRCDVAMTSYNKELHDAKKSSP
ncbi:MAG: hypothetical protein AB1401_14715 [Thermodesulfobacteriota bacterium]